MITATKITFSNGIWFRWGHLWVCHPIGARYVLHPKVLEHMAILDAAANEDGFAYILGFGQRSRLLKIGHSNYFLHALTIPYVSVEYVRFISE